MTGLHKLDAEIDICYKEYGGDACYEIGTIRDGRKSFIYRYKEIIRETCIALDKNNRTAP